MASEPRPNFPISDEEIALMDAALEKTKGNRLDAARALGIDANRVYHVISTHAAMRAKWMNKDKDVPKPGPATDIHRETVSVLSPGDEKIVVAITKEDASLQKGWSRLGFNRDEKKFLAGLQSTYAGNLKSTMDLAYGGAAHANTRLLLALEHIKEKIADIDANPENYERSYMTEHGERHTKGPDEYRLEYYKLFTAISAELRKMGDSMTKANQLRLQMERLLMMRKTETKKDAGWDTAKPAATV